MVFEYDKNKSLIKLAKHGLSLEDASALWAGPAVEVEAKTVGEPRCMIIGKLRDKFYSCIYTKRGNSIRLISARRSRQSEEKLYHEQFKTYIH